MSKKTERNATPDWEPVESNARFSLKRGRNARARWSMRYNCRKRDRRVSHTFHAADLASALEHCRERLDGPLVDDRPPRIGLPDAINETLAASSMNARSAKAWHGYAKRFVGWIEKRFPHVEYWDQITRPMVEEYRDVFKGKAYDTQRHALLPVRATARRMAQVHRHPNVADGIRIKGRKPKAARVILEDALGFVDYVREHAPEFEGAVALQALAGLRLTEASRMEFARIDLEAGLVWVTGELKNEQSERLIPVCGRALEALRRVRANRVRSIRGPEPLVENARGQGVRERTAYARTVRALLKAWNPRVSWKAKDLRNTVTSHFMRARCYGAANRQYEGRSPQGVEESSYFGKLTGHVLEPATPGERKVRDADMATLRGLVTGPLDKAIEAIRAEREAEKEAESFTFFDISASEG